MGIDRDPTADGTLSIDDLDIGGEDFVASGQFFPIAVFGPNENNGNTTTSTTYAEASTIFDIRTVWGEIFESEWNTEIHYSVRMEPGTDETMATRLQNVTDGETVAEITGVTGGASDETVGPTSYTPTTTGSVIRIRLEHKTDTGTNTSRSRNAMMVVGIRV